MKIELKNRHLWKDGTSEVHPEEVPNLLLGGVHPSRIAVTEISEDIQQFNQLSDIQISIGKVSNNNLSFEYNIPDSYNKIDIEEYCRQRCRKDPAYLNRLEDELHEIRSRSMEMLVRTLIYVVDELKRTNTLWGVGRGSSCASLVLFLIGLHSVDPVLYNIPLEEFFHD